MDIAKLYKMYVKNQGIPIIVACIFIIVFTYLFILISLNNKYEEVTQSAIAVHEQLLTITESLDTSNVMKNSETLALITAKAKHQTEVMAVQLEIQKQSLFWYNIGFFGFGTILGYFYLLFYLPKQIESRAALEVDLQIVKLVKERQSDFFRLLNKHDIENQLIYQSHIGVYPDKTSLIQELKYLKFNQTNIICYPDITKKEIDVLIIDYEEIKPTSDSDAIDQINDVLKEVFAKSPKISLFILKEKYDDKLNERLSEWKKDHGIIINFANSYPQLYGNLMNTLKYRNRLLD